MEKKLSLVEGAPSYPRQLYREYSSCQLSLSTRVNNRFGCQRMLKRCGCLGFFSLYLGGLGRTGQIVKTMP